MLIPFEVIVRLMLVIHGLVNEDLPALDHVVVDGRLNRNALRHVEINLTQIRRDDVLEIIRQTMGGNFALLEEHENQFHNQRHRYRFTRKNNPVRYETSRNIGVAMTIQDRPQNNERYAGADLSAAPPSRDARDARTNGAQAEERPLKSPHLSSRERFPAQPSASCSTTNPPPEEPRQPPRCCICGWDIQAIQTSHQVWFDIRETLNKLRPQQLHAFIEVVNAYDPRVLNTIQFNVATPSDELVNDLIRFLQRCHLAGSKCVLCLLDYVLQRVGRLDLAIEIRMIRTRCLFCDAPAVL